MKIAYLFLAHNNIVIEKAIKSLESKDAEFYVHLDLKAQDDFQTLKSMPSVTFIEPRHDVKWGGISIIETLLESCKRIIVESKSDIIVLLSGTDYPLKNKVYINQFFEAHPNKDFIEGYKIPSIECHWLEGGRRRLECYALRIGDRDIATIEPRTISVGNLRQICKIFLKSPTKLLQAIRIWFTYPQRRHPDSLIPYRGEMWWCLRRSTIEKILHYISSHPDFMEYHRNTCIPDEIFFSTLVYNIISKGEIENDCLRFINWGKGIQGNSPMAITMSNKEILDKAIVNPNHLFGRKITDNETIQYINNQIK